MVLSVFCLYKLIIFEFWAVGRIVTAACFLTLVKYNQNSVHLMKFCDKRFCSLQVFMFVWFNRSHIIIRFKMKSGSFPLIVNRIGIIICLNNCSMISFTASFDLFSEVSV